MMAKHIYSLSDDDVGDFAKNLKHDFVMPKDLIARRKNSKGWNFFKKFILFWNLFLFSIIFSWLYAMDNISAYSVYYAKNMFIGKSYDADIVMMMDNLDWMLLPNVDGFRYDFDGGNYVENVKSGSVNGGESLSYYGPNDLTYSDKYSNYYSFNDKFELVYALNRNYEDIHVENPEKIKKEIREVFAPLLDEIAERKPWINLQPVFDWYYQDRFK